MERLNLKPLWEKKGTHYKKTKCKFCGCEFVQENKHNYVNCKKHRKIGFRNYKDSRPFKDRVLELKKRDALERWNIK